LYHCLQKRISYDEAEPSHPTSRSQLDFYRTCDTSAAAATNSPCSLVQAADHG
jgi:hypothetical protein